MQLIQLELVNFCQYRRRTCQFSPGMTAILGPNGSGKSNLVGGIRYALSGELTNAGVKAKNIYQLADPTEESSVSLAFSHAGRTCVVKRYLRPTTAETTLAVEGENIITGDNRATARIMEMLGIDRQILNDIVIVGQGDMFGFLARSPAKRAEAFQRLFQTDRARVVYDALNKHLSGLSLDTYAPADLAARRQELADLQAADAAQLEIIGNTHDLTPLIQEQTAIQERRAIFERLPSLRASLTTAERVVSLSRSSLQAAESAVTATRTRITETERLIADHEASIVKLNADAATITAAQQGCAAAADEARRLLATMEQRRQLEQQREAIGVQIAQKQKALEAPPPTPPSMPFGYDVQATQRASYNNLIAEQQRLSNFVATFDPQTGHSSCPTCGTQAGHLRPQVEAAQLQLPQLAARISTLDEFFAKCRTYEVQRGSYDADLANYNANIRQLTDDLAGLQQQLTNLGDVPPVSEPEEVLKERVLEYDDYEAGLREIRETLPNHAGSLRALRDQLVQLRDQLTRQEAAVVGGRESLEANRQAAENLSQQIGSIHTTQADVDAEAPRARELAERITAVTTARTVLATTRESIAEVLPRIADLEQRVEQLGRMQAWVNLATRMRDLLHHEAAPRFVTQRNLEILQVGTNDNLSMFDTDFRVTAAEGMTYVADFFDGRHQEAERLSPGQQIVLSMAFRIALAFVYADIGFLSLDEPTAYLDEHHIAGFEPVLQRLREFAASHGLQCLIVTHEQRLAPLFDAVIRTDVEPRPAYVAEPVATDRLPS